VTEALSFYRNETALTFFIPRGHFYSPLPWTDAAVSSRSVDLPFPDIDLNEPVQREILDSIVLAQDDFDFPDEATLRFRYYVENGYFRWADGITLFALFRKYRPRRVIEVGSGFSSALMLDINERFFGGAIRLTFVDPHPERFLELVRSNDLQTAELVRADIQELPATTFNELAANDMLFIDSSHVAKVGSDVNYLFFHIIPQLQPGVLIHIHDVYWPFDYDQELIRRGLAWNEAYLVRAFLSFNSEFELIFWVPFAALRWTDFIHDTVPQFMKHAGGSLWIRRRLKMGSGLANLRGDSTS
jgi:predicted O-methyltransferase YrrM